MDNVFDGAAVLKGTVVIGDSEVTSTQEENIKLTPEKLQEIRANLPKPFDTYSGGPVDLTELGSLRQPFKDSGLIRMLDKIVSHTTSGTITEVLEDRVRYLDDFRQGGLSTIASGSTGSVPHIKLSRAEAMIALDLIEMMRTMS